MQIDRVNTILYCQLWQQTVAFYRDVLGLRVGMSNHWFVEFELNEAARLSVADQRQATIKSNEGRGITLSLMVHELEQRHAQLVAVGQSCSDIKPLWGGRVFYLNDPEGNRIELWSEQ